MHYYEMRVVFSLRNRHKQEGKGKRKNGKGGPSCFVLLFASFTPATQAEEYSDQRML